MCALSVSECFRVSFAWFRWYACIWYSNKTVVNYIINNYMRYSQFRWRWALCMVCSLSIPVYLRQQQLLRFQIGGKICREISTKISLPRQFSWTEWFRIWFYSWEKDCRSYDHILWPFLTLATRNWTFSSAKCSLWNAFDAVLCVCVCVRKVSSNVKWILFKIMDFLFVLM